MDETTIAQAKEILAKPSAAWSKEENKFLYKLIKVGNRDNLKALRNEVLLDE